MVPEYIVYRARGTSHVTKTNGSFEAQEVERRAAVTRHPTRRKPTCVLVLVAFDLTWVSPLCYIRYALCIVSVDHRRYQVLLSN